MTTTEHGFFPERKAQLAVLPPLRNSLLTLALAERAIREAETLTEKDRGTFPPAGPALDALWARLAAGDTSLDPVLRDYHKVIADYLPQDEEDPQPPPAWKSALGILALAFMTLDEPETASDSAAAACVEGASLVGMYYMGMDDPFGDEVAWQDRALDLTRARQASRDEYLALPDYPRGSWEEPD